MSTRIRVLLLLALASIPAVASAQQTPSRPTSTAGPRVNATATAVRQPTHLADGANLALAQRKNVGKPIALMVVGGAAIVLGAVIGGDVGTLFMIGGAVALLIGLYRYLQ